MKFRIMKKTVLLLALLVQSSLLLAQGSPAITIKQRGGNETILELSSNPVITFEGEEMVVTNDFTRIQIPLGDIEEYMVNNIASGVKKVLVEHQFQNGRVFFSRIPKGTPISVYSADGRLVTRKVVGETNNSEVYVGDLPNGIYIISVLDKSVKIINR